ncbi:MAG: FAD-binding protein, partial [Victivallales bacterium]|nr:FAD-binding protein [Victivallales bacterium]
MNKAETMYNCENSTPGACRELQVELPPGFSGQDIRGLLAERHPGKDLQFVILRQSLDCRKKRHPRWVLNLAISEGTPLSRSRIYPSLEIPRSRKNKKAVVVGCGPAGFFAALAMASAGLDTTIVEQGAKVEARARKIKAFESGGSFDPNANYAFGEGGAGAFSDGKLTSRTKKISPEREFLLSTLVDAGAPEEILRLAHPHIGSNILRKVIGNLRAKFLDLGGNILFDTVFEGFSHRSGRAVEAITTAGALQADVIVIACGLNSYQTYRKLFSIGIPFRVKPFAMGFRIEHPQSLINKAQWGAEEIPGLKAAEYRLAFKAEGLLPVYTFCMCPGGQVVPAAPSPDVNIVNGMSSYARDGKFANAGIVAAMNPAVLADSGNPSPVDALDALERYERAFFERSQGFAAPSCTAGDFLERRHSGKVPETSYPLGLLLAPLWDMLPQPVTNSIAAAISRFDKQLRGFGQ